MAEKSIAGFANASGGDFYVGVEDKTNILQTARIYSGVPEKVLGWRSAVGLHCKFNRCAV